ncbi:MAG: tetratricopeptide repeat protein [Rubrivivax sp.]|nr:tetratricopeptide repeat protein [Rubrivivax sp.]
MRPFMVARNTAAEFATRMQAAAAAHGRGEHAAATAQVQAALALVPGQPEALRWMGELARARGDDDQAEQWWRRSLAANDAQPAVWNNLGNRLARAQRDDEALAAFARAIVQVPQYGEAHYNRARVLHRLGRREDAAAALQDALACPGGPHEAALQLAAQLQQEAGRLADALGTLDAAIGLAPARGALHHNRAAVLQQLHRPAEALAAHDRAFALGIDAAHAHYNHGHTLQSLGRGDEAVQAYRAALQREPLHSLALYDLARLRWRQGDDAFDAELRAVQAAHPASPLGPGLRGHLLARGERHAEAAEAFREALRRSPAAAGFHDGLGRALLRLGETAAAVAEHEHAVAAAPGDAEMHANLAAARLAAGMPEAAQAAAERAVALAPQDQHALARLGLAWRLRGDPRDGWLNDVPRLVQPFDLEPPPGFADMATFNAALAAELRALHHDRREPVDQTLRRGTQTLGNLFDQGHPLVDALKVRIGEAVSRYIAALPADEVASASRGAASNAPSGPAPGLRFVSHPLLARRSERWRFTDSWSSRLSRGGFHTHHVHPHGWISSAYYVSVPGSVRDEDAGHAGWIQFGQPDLDIGLPARRVVRPRPGRLVLFPSYLWHGTVPFQDDDERLTIAFDVMPA